MNSIHSRNAIYYAVKISSAVKNLTYSLYHVQPSISHFLLEEAKTDGLKQLDLKHLAQKHEQASRAFLDKCKQSMMDLGVNPGHIQVVTQPRKLGRAKDIIEHAQQGHYDAIVVGRRGILPGFKKPFQAASPQTFWNTPGSFRYGSLTAR